MRMRVDGLTKSFGQVRVLRGISVSWEGPGIVGIIGPNGSGKSTLLGILSGHLAPDGGSVTIDDRAVTGQSPEQLARLGVGRTFQIARLVNDLRVWENIAVGMTPSRRFWRGERASRDLALRTAERLQLGSVLDKWPNEISAAEQKRVELARAVVHQPTIVLLDEPVAGLSHRDAAAFAPIIRELGRESLVIVVEHNLQLIHTLAQSVSVLLDGAFAVDGEPADVMRSATVQQAYLGSAR